LPSLGAPILHLAVNGEGLFVVCLGFVDAPLFPQHHAEASEHPALGLAVPDLPVDHEGVDVLAPRLVETTLVQECVGVPIPHFGPSTPVAREGDRAIEESLASIAPGHDSGHDRTVCARPPLPVNFGSCGCFEGGNRLKRITPFDLARWVQMSIASLGAHHDP